MNDVMDGARLAGDGSISKGGGSTGGRRAALALLAASACAHLTSLPAQAQTSARPHRVGVLSFGAPPAPQRPDTEAAFFRTLRELGYVDGQNLVIERRFAMGRTDRLAPLAAELVQAGVDVIVTSGPAPVAAVTAATRSIPIVAVSGSDPVGDGWAQSLARPGGNVTGLTVTFPELASKRLELLKEALPQLTRVAVLYEPIEGQSWDEGLRALDADASRLRLELQRLPVRRAEDIEPAFEAARAARAQAMLAYAVNVVFDQRNRVAELAVSQRLPTMSDFALLAYSGFLLSYGADVDDLARRAAGYVDRILKGARPAEMPVERPTRFQLAINQRTARAVGVVLPQGLLLRADLVIE